MITEDCVSFETAKLLKEKGFDELCRCVYSPEGVFHKSNRTNIYDYYDNALLDEVGNADYFLAPTQAQVMKWLREVHKLDIDVSIEYKNSKKVYYYSVLKKTVIRDIDCLHSETNFDSYEEACEAAIKYYLENLI